MFSAVYGSSLSFYGNIQLAFYNPEPYVWGAWDIPTHYQPPLTKQEELEIEVHRAAPKLDAPNITAPDNDAVLLRLQHSARLQEIANYQYEMPKLLPARTKRRNTDADDFFILM